MKKEKLNSTWRNQEKDKSLKSASNNARINEIAAKYDVHPNRISLRKNEFVRNASSVFAAPRQLTREIEQLNAKLENLPRALTTWTSAF